MFEKLLDIFKYNQAEHVKKEKDLLKHMIMKSVIKYSTTEIPAVTVPSIKYLKKDFDDDEEKRKKKRE